MTLTDTSILVDIFHKKIINYLLLKKIFNCQKKRNKLIAKGTDA